MAGRGRDDPLAPSAAPEVGRGLMGLVGGKDLDRARGTTGGQGGPSGLILVYALFNGLRPAPRRSFGSPCAWAFADKTGIRQLRFWLWRRRCSQQPFRL